MVKLHRKLISASLSALIAVSAVGTVMAANTTQAPISSAAETVGKYATNPNGTGKRGNIKIDGKIDDWSEDMLIAQGAGWDIAPRWKGSHENCVIDCYSLYAAWDDDNLYIGYQMVNSTDTWATPGEGSLMDGGKMRDIHLGVALSINPNNPTITGKMTNGEWLWGDKVTFTNTHADMVMMMSSTVGNGTPALFKLADSQGNLSYDAEHCINFATAGIEYKMADDFLPSELWMLDGISTTPEQEVYGGKGVYADAFKTGKGHDKKYDSFYEMKIPFSAIGITASQLESQGIGVMQFGTRGESPIDCIPHDPSMLDNAMGSYSQDSSTSKEKEDQDDISVPFARVGGDGSQPIPTDPNPTEPDDKSILGDTDGDGAVNLKDAIDIQKSLVTGKTFAGDELKRADVDKSGSVNLRDAMIIQRYTLSLIKKDLGIGKAV